MSAITESLDQVDLLAGASVHSIAACEAAWPRGAAVSWSDAYSEALARFPESNRRRVAFLEGMLGVLRLETPDA